jgi:3-deoxy-D-manno-octulosonic-acid transferase
MNLGYLTYRMLSTVGASVLVPLIWLHHRNRGDNFGRFYHRLGRYPARLFHPVRGTPSIWLHAASVGEVGVAAAIGNVLLERWPECRLMISTIREQGYARARTLMGDRAICFFAPLDLVGATRKALQSIQPDVLALLETEIWPNLIVGARRRGTRTALLNGRLSVRSIHRYRKIRGLMQYTLSHIDAFSMISNEDAQRVQSLGASDERLTVNGNAKFDNPASQMAPDALHWASELLGLDDNTPVFVAGSTRHPEEQYVLDAYLEIREVFPKCLLVIAPRHIERVDQICQWVAERGLTYQRRTDLGSQDRPRSAPVVILDTIGELSMIYHSADVVFCGGSLVPKGGQNLLEPAICGKPVLYGPSMEDFSDVRNLIQRSGGGVTVQSAAMLASAAMNWLANPHQARAAGQAARQAILPHRGAARKHADVIVKLLSRRGQRQGL